MGFLSTHRKNCFGLPTRRWLPGLCVWLLLISTAPARLTLDASDPLGFFTTAADQMLRSSTAQWCSQHFTYYTNTFGAETTNPFSITNIPVLIQGEFVYTPAVNRLLQLAANVYDATTHSFYPSVFRPLFSATVSGDLYITGYTNVPAVTGVADPALSTPFDAAIVAAAGGTNVSVNVYGVPWIIGAKKWMPNFNQFYMLNAVEVTRKLQVTRPITADNPTPPISSFTTNQQYQFSIANHLGCSLWNPYTSNYTGNLTIAAHDTLTMILTNDAGLVPLGYINVPVASVITNFNIWPGTSWGASPPATVLNNVNSFMVPFNGSFAFMTNGIYRYAGDNGAAPYFDASPGWQTNVNTPALPHFGLQTTNRLQVYILDRDTAGIYHVVDYVHFAGPNSSCDINAELADPSDPSNIHGYIWSTNPATANPAGTPYGVVNQINYSAGGPAPLNHNPTFWQTPPNFPSYLPQTAIAEQAFFSSVFNFNKFKYGQFVLNGKIYTNTQLTVQAPYTPTRLIYTNISWQANDPLVHYLASDLNYNNALYDNFYPSDDPAGTLSILLGANGPDNLNNVTKRFAPWGVAYSLGSYRTDGATLTQIKDSLIWRPDDWNFPTGQDWSLAALGRIHRGTPWQTVYLKSSDILTNTGVNMGPTGWAQWTGNTDLTDAARTAPINDWQLMGVLVPLLNTNSPTQLMSVNDPNLSDWLNALNGLAVLTNSGPDLSPPQSDSYVMSGNSAQALVIANAIAQTRMNQPGQLFQSIGDILQAPALAENSPWLNWSDSAQQQYDISDDLYEAIPAQLLLRLRQDSVGAVVPTNGGWIVQFSGAASYDYALQTSTDLVNWMTVGTNTPAQGGFSVPFSPVAGSQQQFYRSVLLP